jgi:hypothetical protein
MYSFRIFLVKLVPGRKPIEQMPPGPSAASRTQPEWAEPISARGRLVVYARRERILSF